MWWDPVASGRKVAGVAQLLGISDQVAFDAPKLAAVDCPRSALGVGESMSCTGQLHGRSGRFRRVCQHCDRPWDAPERAEDHVASVDRDRPARPTLTAASNRSGMRLHRRRIPDLLPSQRSKRRVRGSPVTADGRRRLRSHAGGHPPTAELRGETLGEVAVCSPRSSRDVSGRVVPSGLTVWSARAGCSRHCAVRPGHGLVRLAVAAVAGRFPCVRRTPFAFASVTAGTRRSDRAACSLRCVSPP